MPDRTERPRRRGPAVLSAICASHSPLMGHPDVAESGARSIDEAFHGLRRIVDAFRPDLVIQFSPDHFNGFFYDVMPAFCIGTAAEAVGDWGTRAGPLDVAEADAAALGRWLLASGFDVALSRRMRVDHGFTQIWESMFDQASPFPLLPIFVNCCAPPLPSYRRARLLGEAVGRFALDRGGRILLASSGGLSHDPPVPNLADAPPKVRERLMTGRAATPEERADREARVIAAGRAAAVGEGPCMPLNPSWDRNVLALFEDGDLSAFDHFDGAGVSAAAGRGANETLCWVAALAALSAAGTYRLVLSEYQPMPAWIAGMALVAARTLGDDDA